MKNKKKEALYHAFLVVSEKSNMASIKYNEGLKILLEKEGSFENIYNENTNTSIEQIVEENKAIKFIKDKIENLTFNMFKYTDSDFPKELKKYIGTPAVIYTRGDTEIFNMNSIAAVGTRRINPEDNEDKKAIEKAKEFLKDKIKNNYAIVSGLASGCDTIAHKTAIENNGKTIAVLGTTIDKFYPPENKELQEEIIKNHLLVSQYPIGIQPFQGRFAYKNNLVHRNATTVALAKKGILVIKTYPIGGTNYAIKNCVKQRKQLYVIDSEANRNAFNSGKILKQYYEINWI